MLPNFLGRTFAAIRISEFSVESRGKCCPIFWEELLRRFDFQNLVLKTGGIAAQLSGKKFCNDSIFRIEC